MKKKAKLLKQKSQRRKKVQKVLSSKVKSSSNVSYEEFDLAESDDGNLDEADDQYFLESYEIDQLNNYYD